MTAQRLTVRHGWQIRDSFAATARSVPLFVARCFSAAALLVTATPTPLLADTGESLEVLRLFQTLCIETIPDFSDAADRAETMGFKAVHIGDGTYELWATDIGGGWSGWDFSPNARFCHIGSARADQQALFQLVEPVLARLASRPLERQPFTDYGIVTWRYHQWEGGPDGEYYVSVTPIIAEGSHGGRLVIHADPYHPFP